MQAQPVDPAEPNGPENRLNLLAGASERIAEIYAQIGQQADALKAYEEALSYWTKLEAIRPYPMQVGKVLVKIGRLQRQLGRPAEALQNFEQSVAKFEG